MISLKTKLFIILAIGILIGYGIALLNIQDLGSTTIYF